MEAVRIVLANGCFDILHVGHILHLTEARAMGDFLIVSLTSDEFVNKGPGRPINNWTDRARCLNALRCVGSVYKTDNAVEAIRTFKPAIFVKGVDYVSGDKFTEDIVSACKECGTELRYTTSEKKSADAAIRMALA